MEENNKTTNSTAQLIKDGVKEITIRSGRALDLQHPEKVQLEGNINAPGQFIAKRKAQHKPEGVHVIFNEVAGTIILVCDEKDKFGTIVTGSLLKNEELEEFGINEEDSLFSHKELIKLLKFKKHLFAEASEHKTLVDQLMSFTAKLSAEYTACNNDKGKKFEQSVSRLTTEIKLSFVLNTPIFKGFEKKKFKVEICLDARNATDVDFWFESTELYNLVVSEKERIFKEKKEELGEYVTIEK